MSKIQSVWHPVFEIRICPGFQTFNVHTSNAWLVKNIKFFCLRTKGWLQRSVLITYGYNCLQSPTTTSRRSTRTSWRAFWWGDAGRRLLMPFGLWVDSPRSVLELIRILQVPSQLWAHKVRTFEAPNRYLLVLDWKKKHFFYMRTKTNFERTLNETISRDMKDKRRKEWNFSF